MTVHPAIPLSDDESRALDAIDELTDLADHEEALVLAARFGRPLGPVVAAAVRNPRIEGDLAVFETWFDHLTERWLDHLLGCAADLLRDEQIRYRDWREVLAATRATDPALHPILVSQPGDLRPGWFSWIRERPIDRAIHTALGWLERAAGQAREDRSLGLASAAADLALFDLNAIRGSPFAVLVGAFRARPEVGRSTAAGLELVRGLLGAAGIRDGFGERVPPACRSVRVFRLRVCAASADPAHPAWALHADQPRNLGFLGPPLFGMVDPLTHAGARLAIDLYEDLRPAALAVLDAAPEDREATVARLKEASIAAFVQRQSHPSPAGGAR